MKVFAGYCRGGPLDGQQRAVPEVRTMTVPEIRGQVDWSGSGGLEIVTHEYRYILGQWIWQGQRQ